ncbi:MAG: hypothetical protein HFH54_00190 [Lachnospiraceae bacterium]|nr:hypothetical protein [Lachnospiraceae bacterium]
MEKIEEKQRKSSRHIGMDQKSRLVLWALNLLACADPMILYQLSEQGDLIPLLVYRIGMPLVWGMLWAVFVQNFKKSLWDRESRKQAWTMMLAMLVLNVLSVSVALSRQGSLAVYSLILIGLYLGKIVARKLS